MEIQLNKFGEILYHKLTEEPSMVIWQFRYFTLVKRPVMGQNGIRYKYAMPLTSELETLQEQTARTLTAIQARNAVAEASFGTEQGPMPALNFKKPS